MRRRRNGPGDDTICRWLNAACRQKDVRYDSPNDRSFYTPWGKEDSRQQSLSRTAGNPYRYVGQLGYYHHHQDQNLGDWMQLGVRFYNPEIGRFERRDPVEGYESAYTYVEGQPISYVDPAGLKKERIHGGYDIEWWWPWCVKDALSKANKMHDTNDKMAHCYAHCRIMSCLGGGPLLAFILDSITHDDEPNDVEANRRGLKCGFLLGRKWCHPYLYAGAIIFGFDCRSCCKNAVRDLPNAMAQ